MNVTQLKALLVDVPDEMEIIGGSGEHQAEVIGVYVCQWRKDGRYYGDYRRPEDTVQADTPVLKIDLLPATTS